MVSNNPIFGIGEGRFSTSYNTFQATYFKKNGLDTPESQLAYNFI